MNINFETKLGVGILVVFALVIAGFMLWTPIRVKYYYSKLYSQGKEERLSGLNGLIKLGECGKKTLAEFCGSKEEADFIYELRTGTKKTMDNSCRSFFDSYSDLCSASHRNHIHVARFLLDDGADINGGSIPPIILASEEGHLNILRFLITEGADINARTDYMVYVSSNFKIEPIKASSATALDCAKTDEIKKLLREHGAKTAAELDAEKEAGEADPVK